MNTIKLFNRHGYSVTLNQIKDNDYLISGDKDAFYYFRVIYDEKNKNVKAVDPSGGPFISVGFEVNNQVVDKITFVKGKGYVATLKDKIDETN